jgi:thiamine kinase-like enzyme
MGESEIVQILLSLGIAQKPLSIEPFVGEEDDKNYQVWRILLPEGTFVLKAAKGYETEIYHGFFRNAYSFVPRILSSGQVNGTDYLLMEYISGENLMYCTREKLIPVLDSMIQMQSAFWQDTAHSHIGLSFEKSISGRENRLNFLNDADLEQIYREFLRDYASVPRTLCHDDLLPFNVIVGNTLISKDRAVFIDWEYGGILPYPVSLARLIAHGEEGEEAFFYMTEADRAFALDYYYRNFISGKGISREIYDRTMALFLFYEYCEWVYLGNRYADADPVRFSAYFEKAKSLATKILKNNETAG